MTDLESTPLSPAVSGSDGPEPLVDEKLGAVVAELWEQQAREANRLQTIATWYRDRASATYSPHMATAEYKTLVQQSKLNILPLVVDTAAQSLFIDGYRPNAESGRPESSDNAPVWDLVWQRNRMDARQATLWRGSLKYGWSYARVEPAVLLTRDGQEKVPRITPYSPRTVTCLYDDPVNDEWAAYGLVLKRAQRPGEQGPVARGTTATVLDRWHAYQMRWDGGQWVLLSTVPHGLGVVPLVRFPDEQPTDDDPDIVATGKVEPLLPIQQQINQISYQLNQALHFGAFRQRWATGMTIEKDAAGNVIPPFNAAVNMVWTNSEPTAKFGDFGQTDVSGFIDARDKVMLFGAATSQIPPHNILTGSAISNLSAEALVALEASRRADTRDHQYTFGEGAEQLLRLSGLAAGDLDAWYDMSAEVRWGDTTPRSLAAIADAVLKLAELEIPVQFLWEMIPGVTDRQLADWAAGRAEQQRARLVELQGMLEEQREQMQQQAASGPQNGQDGSEDAAAPAAA